MANALPAKFGGRRLPCAALEPANNRATSVQHSLGLVPRRGSGDDCTVYERAFWVGNVWAGVGLCYGG